MTGIHRSRKRFSHTALCSRARGAFLRMFRCHGLVLSRPDAVAPGPLRFATSASWAAFIQNLPAVPEETLRARGACGRVPLTAVPLSLVAGPGTRQACVQSWPGERVTQRVGTREATHGCWDVQHVNAEGHLEHLSFTDLKSPTPHGAILTHTEWRPKIKPSVKD